MKYNQLGKSRIQVSAIGFGCMSLGPDHAANATLLHRALDAGITLLDTADLYDKGENEVSVGKALRGRRQEVILATKVGNQWRPDDSGWDWNPRKAYILQAVERSLRRLQTDYLDLYQLHGGTVEDPIDETIEAFELLKEQGKIRAYGISSIRPNVIREYVRKSGIASVMMQYSLLDRRPEESSLALLHEHQISVLARGSYAQGLLAGKPAKPYLNYPAAEVQRAAEAVRQVAEQAGSAAEVAVGFVLAKPVVASAVLGIRTEEQLRAALQAAEAGALATEQLQTLRHALPPNQYEQHR
ncbi:aldo/keto reductase [Hymenobacter chitinivorans]|uniref:Aryl-alcohol dehydrogenase-like predicted oxidoreductase n=1 Tax=Hymenobacter chitinivorans DSM 11115 TaxID=1121954 RepID=A0A2M9BQY2_9BACT|nr:aldo/keto reductase [Hymenobacter chitinivorans]PJJ60312.1 aryl-alcohol dehydrogenase-like predicted oxidoreductase [Hymenobacter chitinivorans DSM 11115]